MLGFDAPCTLPPGDDPSPGKVPRVNADQANFAFSGVAYTRPAANTANFTYAAANKASGFYPVSFGTPSVTAHPVTGFVPVTFGPVSLLQKYVAGFKATSFGAPAALEAVHPSGFAPVHFGPSITLLPHAVALRPVHFGPVKLLPHAVALRPLHFGALSAYTHNHVAAWRSTRLGTPTAPTARTAAAAGFRTSRLGHPVCIRYLRKRYLHAHVYTLRAAHFGTPSA